jgi:hypothetical protein
LKKPAAKKLEVRKVASKRKPAPKKVKAAPKKKKAAPKKKKAAPKNRASKKKEAAKKVKAKKTISPPTAPTDISLPEFSNYSPSFMAVAPSQGKIEEVTQASCIEPVVEPFVPVEIHAASW